MDEKHENIKLDPPRKIHNRKHHVGVKVVKFEDLTGLIATDQTGHFPITSAQGNTYIMVLYDYDSNLIHATGIKSRKKEDLIDGYNKMYEDLKLAGIQPLFHKLDNEKSKDMIESIKEKGLKFQLAPPGDH